MSTPASDDAKDRDTYVGPDSDIASGNITDADFAPAPATDQSDENDDARDGSPERSSTDPA